jgi:UDP-glucuronate 4-epimerase
VSQQINILVTGAAGFIGWKVCEFLLTKPELIPNDIMTNDSMTIQVIGIDNLNNYYDVRFKQWRLDQLKKYPNFKFHKLDIEDYAALKKLFSKYSVAQSSVIASDAKQFNAAQRAHNRSAAITTASQTPKPQSPFIAVINLAARAGVRYSMENPFVYYATNVIGNLNLLELSREFSVKKFILASTSSLYAGQKMPFKEDLPVNEPISPYAASKKSAEMTCYTYHHLYDIDVTILRYFTVYGPASRPDMSPLRFISWVYQGKPVIIYGDGTQSRDFTYVDDIARGTIMALKALGFEMINLGCDKPYKLLDFLGMIEKNLGKKAKITHEPTHPADMEATWADITKAEAILKWKPNIILDIGVTTAIDWYVDNEKWASNLRL